MTDLTTAIPHQKIYIDPHDGKLFDFNNVSSRVYLGQTINNLLKVYGDNFVIEGFRPLSVKYETIEDNSEVISVSISSGRAIIDTTYIEVTETSHLLYDVTNLDDSGFLILSLDYNYLLNPYTNETSLKLNFFNSAANNNYSGYIGFNNNSKFFTETSRIILNKITFNKQAKKILQYFKNNTLFSSESNSKITLLNKEYDIYPKSPLLKDFIRILQNYA